MIPSSVSANRCVRAGKREKEEGCFGSRDTHLLKALARAEPILQGPGVVFALAHLLSYPTRGVGVGVEGGGGR